MSSGWGWFIFVLSYIQMYLVSLDRKDAVVKIVVEGLILLIFWTDFIINKYILGLDITSKKVVRFFDWKFFIILTVTIDWIIFFASIN